MPHHDISSLALLPTEQRNPATLDIDTIDTLELVRRLNREDATVPLAVERVLPDIARAVDVIVARLERGGRLVYVGAGTSGRLGVLDASECPPTYNTPPEMVIGLIAGGDHALRHSVETVEDSPEQGGAAVDGIGLTAADVVVGIAASGRTPWVVGALERARAIGAATIAVANVPASVIGRHADLAIEAVTGPEPVTGSTRMKAGTAQKLVLNMLSTASMIRLGKTWSNLMVDVQTSNEKLRDRAVRIVAAAAEIDAEAAANLLARSGGEVKVAIVMALLGADAAAARTALDAAGGTVRRALAGGAA